MQTNIILYRRHGLKEGSRCPHSDNRYHPRCGCPIWMQFQYAKNRPLFNVHGHRLRHGQNLVPTTARSWGEAQDIAKAFRQKLDAGIPTADHSGLTIKDATDKWLKVREQDGRKDDKARSMVKKLLEFCERDGVRPLQALTTDKMLEFRLSLPFRTGDSSSLKVHWSVLGGFFRFAVDMGWIAKNPIPSARQNKQFAIRFEKPEVQVPSRKEVDDALAAADGPLKIMMLLQRWSACAMIDAYMLRRDEMTGNLIRRRRQKTEEPYRIRIPQWLADAITELPGREYAFQSGGMGESWYKKQYRKVWEAAKLPDFHSHLFRHYRISELLSSGVHVDDVALMVGTSPAEIRKTYRHWIKEEEDRLDAIQAKEFKRHSENRGNALQ
ncbi:MAG TPA: hypothetical protein VGS27_03155 [Candidatus Sulfotelmatobacter sp.]|nr:hypothetical protein [Candidatus Sulfotelmatobacter sp.]